MRGTRLGLRQGVSVYQRYEVHAPLITVTASVPFDAMHNSTQSLSKGK